MSNRKDYFKQYQETRKRVNVSFSPDEFESIQKLCEALNILGNKVAPATLVRRLTLAMLKGERLPDGETAQELRNLSFLLRNFSNNLNQIARNSHRVDQVIDENKVFDLIAGLESTVKDFVKNPKKGEI